LKVDRLCSVVDVTVDFDPKLTRETLLPIDQVTRKTADDIVGTHMPLIDLPSSGTAGKTVVRSQDQVLQDHIPLSDSHPRR
jgi:hypothetical protein